MRPKQIIIVAGGSGTRMGGGVPKQFLPVGGVPILIRSLHTFGSTCPNSEIVIVMPTAYFELWNELCAQHKVTTPHKVVQGGETRFHSVANGIAALTCNDDALIAVHDAVRPFVAPCVIVALFDKAAVDKAAIPVVEVVDSMREILPIGSKTVDRTAFRQVQTPQVFDSRLLRRAYEQIYTPAFTDDASVVEALGMGVTLVPGNRDNIKITSPLDLKVAQVLAAE